MASDFMIGLTTSIYDFLSLDQVVTETQGDPDWSYQPFSQAIRTGAGLSKGVGFPIAKWRWNAIADLDREALRAFVGSDLSAAVCIRTATNEVDVYGAIVFQTFSCVMHWPDTDEDFQADKVLGMILTFTHLVEVTP